MQFQYVGDNNPDNRFEMKFVVWSSSWHFLDRNTLAHANEHRNWRIYADFAQILIHQARNLYADEAFGVELEQTVYALDITTIDLCLSLFPWARFQRRKAAIKLHTARDLRGSIPIVIKITDAKEYDLYLLDELLPEPGCFYIMDRGYLDFARLYTLNLFKTYFIIRARSNLQFRRIYSRSIDWAAGLRCDQTIALRGISSSRHYPEHLRRVRLFDAVGDNHLTFLTNNFILPADLIAELYKCRWQIELFFRWIK